jgi:hypothetical protein
MTKVKVAPPILNILARRRADAPMILPPLCWIAQPDRHIPTAPATPLPPILIRRLSSKYIRRTLRQPMRLVRRRQQPTRGPIALHYTHLLFTGLIPLPLLPLLRHGYVCT